MNDTAADFLTRDLHTATVNLALAVLIYHEWPIAAGDAADTLATWKQATGSDDCSAATLCELARKVLEETNV